MLVSLHLLSLLSPSLSSPPSPSPSSCPPLPLPPLPPPPPPLLLPSLPPQACKDCICINLLANVSGTRYDGQLCGEPYVTWDVKVLNHTHIRHTP